MLFRSKTKGKGKGLQFRKLGISDSERMTEEDIKEFKKWHAENVPNIPFEILEQMIVINSTESAWGVFENGVAKTLRLGLLKTLLRVAQILDIMIKIKN